MSTKFTFTTPIQYADGTAISASDLAALTYKMLVDTVNPPLKAFPVPAANIAAATLNTDTSKTVTVLFTDIGFTPADNVTYYATAADDLGALDSGDANIVSFKNGVAAKPPGNFTVA
jgi:hypothetical protein